MLVSVPVQCKLFHTILHKPLLSVTVSVSVSDSVNTLLNLQRKLPDNRTLCNRPTVNQDVIYSQVTIYRQTLTGLKKSPIHLAIISDNMIGMPKVMSPVHSITITVKLIVMRTVPPN